MSYAELLEQAKQLSPSDKYALAAELLNQVSAETAEADLSEAQRAELERRNTDYLANPEDILTWDQVKANLRARQH